MRRLSSARRSSSRHYRDMLACGFGCAWLRRCIVAIGLLLSCGVTTNSMAATRTSSAAVSSDASPAQHVTGATGATGAAKEEVYYDLPEMVVNFRAMNRSKSYLRVKVTLDLAKPTDVARVDDVLPRILDDVEICTRDLDDMQIEDSKGINRLRDYLIERVDAELQPVKVKDIFFKELLVL